MEHRLAGSVIEAEDIVELSPTQRETLLRRSWMANDGLWFYQAFANYGPEVANSWNIAVVREFGRLEMRRLLRALGISRITSWAQYRQIFQIAADLYVGDLFSYTESFDGAAHHIRVKTCFAYNGVARAGVAKVYHCGPLERVTGWFEALKLPVKISPEVGHCQMAHFGECAYSLSVEFPEDAGSEGPDGRAYTRGVRGETERPEMSTQLSSSVSPARSRNGVYHVALVGPTAEVQALPVTAGSRQYGSEAVVVDGVDGRSFNEYVKGLGGRALAAAIIVADDESIPAPLQVLRGQPGLSRTRVYLLSRTPDRLQLPPDEDPDIEGVLDLTHLTAEELGQAIESGIRAHRALGTNPLIPEYYLDATYNQVFDWFETTKWDWREVDLSKIQRDQLTDDDLVILRELACGEFGTLPGAHNFLREWVDEYSFSSWALSWGAEEARHALVQSRYLRTVGRDVRAKYAMYKREPYPMGNNRAGTLMMNVISESRAAEYYKALSRLTREPVLQRIWKLLGRDESRHARAFFVFCKELCDLSDGNTVAALQMTYVWLADRSRGVKHPAGFFYPHSGSIEGIRLVEKSVPAGTTDIADRKVLAMIRNLLDDRSIHSVRDLKAHLRARVA